MKNLKLFAGLTAFVCCFQSEACITSIAEEADTSIVETAQMKLFTDDLSEEERTELWLEYDSVSIQICKYIQDNIAKEELANPVLSGRMSDSCFGGGFTHINIKFATPESAEKIKAFCDEKGFTGQYDIRYIPIFQTDVNETSAMSETADKIQQFMYKNAYSGSACVQGKWAFDEENAAFYISGFEIRVEPKTEEALEAVKAYCEEQGFTDLYAFNFKLYDEAQDATDIDEMQANLTAGDVTLDGNVDILDVITLNKAILGKETLTTLQNKAADVNRDNKIDASDALEILKQVVGMTE